VTQASFRRIIRFLSPDADSPNTRAHCAAHTFVALNSNDSDDPPTAAAQRMRGRTCASLELRCLSMQSTIAASRRSRVARILALIPQYARPDALIRSRLVGS
jgi:hypothetical protein